MSILEENKIDSQINDDFLESSLDEPISQTILRDVKMIGRDLWGPLIVCLILSVILSSKAADNQTQLIFAGVFVIIWFGAGVVTVNALLLGGKVSFFQSVCVLGYSLFPLVISALLCIFFRHIIARTVFVLVGFVWSTIASLGFISPLIPKNKKTLALYPVFLFYFTISWLILVN
ncbi:protein yipf6 [Anaeramoeba flamelloides]|uniref:Protein YIPF n=1 Tax=Anaeramoeba flamelloides TaxID=1746091 RepID=A0AAV7YWT7_9EUKA|nr:protein yipf6 [Anaeramoeba flamelloides]KAJ6248307.1 protein yipf6 [Anaeramoeba flamelloides]